MVSIKDTFWDKGQWTAPLLVQPCMIASSPYSTRAGIHAPTHSTQIQIQNLYYYLRIMTKLYSLNYHAVLYFRGTIPRGGALNFFFGGYVPRGFQSVGSRERIFLEKWGSWEQKFGSRELQFWPKHRWKCKNFLKIENGSHKNDALMVNW